MTKLKLTRDRCQCTVCEEFFNSTFAFDKHRIGDWFMRRCRTPDIMESIGMSRNAKGFWISSKRIIPPSGTNILAEID